MFTYVGNIIDGGVEFWQFLADGKSIFQIANMYEQKEISADLIKPDGYQLKISLLNPHEYVFKQGVRYHLFCNSVNNYVQIDCKFAEKSYVCSWYRKPISPVKKEILDLLFKQPVYILDRSDTDEYGSNEQQLSPRSSLYDFDYQEETAYEESELTEEEEPELSSSDESD